MKPLASFVGKLIFSNFIHQKPEIEEKHEPVKDSDMTGIYIHIPFCRNKCVYCDFYSGGVRVADWDKYSEALFNELDRRKGEISGEIPSLYIGGGTPSLMPSEKLEILIKKIVEIAGGSYPEEITMEVNPEDVNDDNCLRWKDLGINRISVGIQTLHDNELKAIGRRHDSFTALEAIKSLKRYFDNVSVDLIFGLPLQSVSSYSSTLNEILKLKPSHISVYSLMLEEGTALYLLEKQGKITLPGEDEWIEMYEITSSRLKEAGYLHYEVSNYALPGFISRHNSSYWESKPYIGIGPGAHSYDGLTIRRRNPTNLHAYQEFYLNKDAEGFFYEEERLTLSELREEMIMTRLRTEKGLSLRDYQQRFGEEEKEKLLKKGNLFIKQGKIIIEEERLKIPESSILLLDNILVALI